MSTRKDQLQSYQFMLQRVVSAVMVHETDPEQAPLRRGVGAVFAGVMLTGLVAIGFGVYGVISGNVGDRWQSEGQIVIERETGAHFVYRDGVLQPVLNYTSARLVSATTPGQDQGQGGLLAGLMGGAGQDEPRRVASRNLTGIPRAVTVGIPGAPDSLPSSDQAAGTPWTMCSVLAEDPAGSPTTTTVLLAGERVPGGDPLADRGMLVRDAEEDATYLIWRSHRYQLTGDDPGQVVGSLYGFPERVMPAGSAWLNGLPAGQDIGPIDVGDAGEESSQVPGREIGAVVFHPVAEGEQYYLVRDDGLAYLTELQLLLLRGQYEVDPVEISSAEVAVVPRSDALAPADGDAAPPPAPPELLPIPTTGEETVLCAETQDAETPQRINFGGDLTALEGALPTGGESAEGARLADLVLVPPGRIAVVRAMPSDTAFTGSYHLVTDQGIRYPVPTAEVLGMLGYEPTHAVDMPSALVQRIPAGPTLSSVAARQPAPPPAGS